MLSPEYDWVLVVNFRIYKLIALSLGTVPRILVLKMSQVNIRVMVLKH